MGDLFDMVPDEARSIRSMLIEASAGSGKTYQLANRFLALVGAGVEPSEVVALTFTRKAAGEFTERILTSLAEGASGEKAVELAKNIRKTWAGDAESGQPAMVPAGIAGVELDQMGFLKMLRDVVDVLDRIALSTIDSFFLTVVRQFSFELGLAGFELLDDTAKAAQRERVLAELFDSDPRLEDQRRVFLQAFKVATFGKEETRIEELLSKYLDQHHERLVSVPELERWGNFDAIWDGECTLPEVKDFAALAERARPLLSGVHEKPDKRWISGMEKLLDWFEVYVPGQSDANAAGSMLGNMVPLLDDLRSGEAVHVYYKKEHRMAGELAEAIRDLLGGWLRDELMIACKRTQGMFRVLDAYESAYDKTVRSRGKLAFSDLTQLLANGGLELGGRMESLVYRMDRRFKHWLLDEFQDTSRAQWRVLEALIDEAVIDPEGDRSLFVVGDGKQGIYGWRGGDVRLFSELMRREDWQSRTDVWPMAKSWRSSQVVLDLVNTVCDPEASGMRERFAGVDAVERWKFIPHTAAMQKSGHATVTMVDASAEAEAGDKPDAEAKAGARARVVAERIREINPIARGWSCAVLVRSNKLALRFADEMRKVLGDEIPVEVGSEIDVATDSPVGLAVMDFFRWLNSPSDTFAREHLRATVVENVLGQWGASDEEVWATARRISAHSGVLEVMTTLAAGIRGDSELSKLNDERLADIEQAAARFDQIGGTLDEWLASLEHLKRRDHAHPSAVQVLTIHASKGLEYDLVFLPAFSSKSMGDTTRQEVIEDHGDDGVRNLLLKPKSEVADGVPEVSALVNQMKSDQTYEDFCAVYVGLTRAARAVHVVVDAQEPKDEKGSADAWILGAVDGGLEKAQLSKQVEHVCYADGDPDWFEDKPVKAAVDGGSESVPKLAQSVARRKRRAPSDHGSDAGKSSVAIPVTGSYGLRFGSEVHALFERVEWSDEFDLEGGVMRRLEADTTDAAAVVRKTLRQPEVIELFARPEKGKLFLEQPVEGILDGVWISGVIDRLVVNYDTNVSPISAKVIDFKTDAVDDESVLVERYAKQLKTYQHMVALTLDVSPSAVTTVIVATHLGRVIKLQ